MKFFRRQPRPQIDVELKMIGFFLDEYVNIVTRIKIKSESSPVEMLLAARDTGIVSKRLYSYLNRKRREIPVLINGQAIPGNDLKKACLHSCDSVLIYSPLSGG